MSASVNLLPYEYRSYQAPARRRETVLATSLHLDEQQQADLAEWLTQHNRWVESHYAELVEYRYGSTALDEALCAPRGPQQLLEGVRATDDPRSYMGPRMPSLKKMKEGERPVEFLYRTAPVADRREAEAFAYVVRLRRKREQVERDIRAYALRKWRKRGEHPQDIEGALR